MLFFFIVPAAQGLETTILFAQEKNTLQQRRKLIIFSVVLLGGFLLAVYVLPRKKSAPAVRGKEVVITLPERRPGSPDVCKFWRPWGAVLAPLLPSDVMATIAQRARTRAGRTEAFADWAKAPPKKPEHVCAVGTTINGVFTFDLLKDLTGDAKKADSNCKPNKTALDFSMAMHVDHGKKANLNAFTLELSTGPLSAKRLRQFTTDQALLVYKGYG